MSIFSKLGLGKLSCFLVLIGFFENVTALMYCFINRNAESKNNSNLLKVIHSYCFLLASLRYSNFKGIHL